MSRVLSSSLDPRPPEALRPGSGAMFDRIARRYDLLNRLISLGLDRGWRRRTVRAVEPRDGGRYLDLATGTADVALEILRQAPGAEVVGVDPSAEMLAIGRRKLAARGASRARLERGEAERLSFDDGSFDGVTIAFGIRNVVDRGAALAEMARVIRPGGRVAILEGNEPRGGLTSPFARFHLRHIVPRLGAWLSGQREYRYLQTSIAAFPPSEEFAAMMRRRGFEDVVVRPLTFGAVCLYVGRVPGKEPR